MPDAYPTAPERSPFANELMTKIIGAQAKQREASHREATRCFACAPTGRRMRKPPLHHLLLCLIILSFAGAVRAQSAYFSAPLDGPILATTTAEQDHIRLYDVTNGEFRDLSFGISDHVVWDFSADGCRVLFTLSSQTSPPRVYSARLDGTDLRPLVTYDAMPPDAWSAWEPDWSPDGTRIAFTMTRETAYLEQTGLQAQDDRYEYRVAWVPADGGTPTFYSVAGDEHSPQWSPDGQWLAYIAYEVRVPGAEVTSTAVPTPEAAPTLPPSALLREADLWAISVDGQTKYRLTFFDTGSVHDPRWSPDGTLIGFVYSPMGNNDTAWMIANAPGSIPTQISLAWSLILDLTWVPDGTALVSAMRDFGGETANRLWRLPLVGNADTDASLYVADPALTYADYPRFSADGRWLALRTEYSLALVDTESGEWSLLDGALGNTAPVWSPAGFTGEAGCAT